MVSLYNWNITLVKEGLQDTEESVEQGVIYDSTGLSWGLESIIFKFLYQVLYMKNIENFTVIE